MAGTTGIIAEYNPFHDGHLYHMREAKSITGAENVVVVMSGNFVQRGEPAISGKQARALSALQAGADMVVELPVLYATSAATDFARAAATLLCKTGIVDSLCFGSESGDMGLISAACDILEREDEDFKGRLRQSLAAGASFAAAVGKAAGNGEGGALFAPNDTLGALYLLALRRLGPDIVPHAIKRGAFPSASSIREAMRNEGVYPALKDYGGVFRYLMKTRGLSDVLGMGEGLGNRFEKYCGQFDDLDDIIAAVKTKRYTRTRIQRAALHAVLGITKADAAKFSAAGGPQYIRVLGFRKEKAFLLAAMEERASLPVIVNVKKDEAKLDALGRDMLRMEVIAGDIYGLAAGNAAARLGAEYAAGVIVV